MDTLPDNLDLQLGTSAAYAVFTNAAAACTAANAAYAGAKAASADAKTAHDDALAAFADALAAAGSMSHPGSAGEVLAEQEVLALPGVGRICPSDSLTFVDALKFHQRWPCWLGKLP